jgi:hypothetical protein
MLHAQGKKHRNINTLQLKSHATTTALSTTNRTTATPPTALP